MRDRRGGRPPRDALPQPPEHHVVLRWLGVNPGTTVCPTVGLDDDDLLGHVNEAPGQVAGVSGAERRVGQALAGAVG